LGHNQKEADGSSVTKTSGRAVAKAASSTAGSLRSSVPTTPSVNVHDLWAQLLGAGLVTSGSGSSEESFGKIAAIPGLEVQEQQQSTEGQQKSKEFPMPSEEEAKAKKDVKEEPGMLEEAKTASAQPQQPLQEIKPIVLSNRHHPSLKE